VRRPATAAASAAFFALAPGVVAGLVPWLLTRWRAAGPVPYGPVPRAVGVLLVAAGAAVLVHAFARFVMEGAGTPAPVAPAEQLVVGGLYRHVRNPMYLAVVTTILGQALLLARPVLLGYAALVAFAFVAFVRGYEEPSLRRRFGGRYEAYRAAVPGWWPRLRPWRG
jgi:protein-S-isoprenylcysteine O-methyltransferase Ste14